MKCCCGVAVGMAGAIGSVLVGACSAPPAPPDPPKPRGGGEMMFAEMPRVAPMAYFEQRCANCHGPMGMFYGEAFATTLDDAALIKVVREMVEGPAQSSLDDLSLKALVAFHRALRSQPASPFVSVSALAEGQLRGEVTPDSTVSIVVDGVVVDGTVEGTEWSGMLPSGWERARKILMVATKTSGGGRTEIDVVNDSFSHQR